MRTNVEIVGPVNITRASEEQLREYAHALWETAGKPEGRDAEF
jgi:hypothetical protein